MWYQTDSNTRILYMTWQEEIDIAVDLERQRADDAENRLFKAIEHTNEIRKKIDEEKVRAEAEKIRADEEKARADKYEKMLRDLGKL